MDRQEEKVSVQMVFPMQQDEVILEECRTLWKQMFDDTDQYVAYYFEYKWRDTETLLLSGITGDVYSMLHMNPYHVMFDKKEFLLHYIVGVCTVKEKRSKGYMGRLLKESFAYLYDRQEPFTFLLPANPAIYLPYDFRYFYTAERLETVINAAADKGKCKLDFVDFEEASAGEREQLVSLSEKLLSARFQIFIRRSLAYFEDISREMKACDGQLLLIYKEGHLMGYAEYGYEGECFEILELVGQFEQEDVIGAVGTFLCRAHKKDRLDYRIEDAAFLTDSRKGKRPVMMVRVIHFQTCASMLRSREELEVTIRITDQYIPENNGVWQLTIREEECVVTKMSDETVSDRELTIAEFGEEFFEQRSSYLNEMV